jgi:hypothetical protein
VATVGPAVDEARVATVRRYRDDEPDDDAIDTFRCAMRRRPMKTHELKTWPQPFTAIWEGRKVHQIRRRDRPFAVGDKLVLREWDPSVDPNVRYTGRVATAIVSYISMPDTFGLPSDLCVMSLVGIERVSS